MTRIRWVLLGVFWAILLAVIFVVTSGVDYVGQPVWVVRDAGSAFGVRHVADSDSRWRTTADGVHLWGNGQNKPDVALGRIVMLDGKPAIEITAPGLCVVMNNTEGSSISMCPGKGCLVFVDERKGAGHVLDVIGECEE